MPTKQLLLNEIETLSQDIINEVYHYVTYLKQMKISDITLVSENSLAKDWLLPDEDKAWRDL